MAGHALTLQALWRGRHSRKWTLSTLVDRALMAPPVPDDIETLGQQWSDGGLTKGGKAKRIRKLRTSKLQQSGE